MRSLRNWSPRYIVDRISLAIYHRRHPAHPWLTDQAIGILSSWLRPDDVGMEFGSGRSTMWTASRVGSLISVEHHRGWYQKVERDLAREGFNHVDYRLVEEDQNGANPEQSPYVQIAHERAPESMDYVLVDGIFRDECAKAALPAIKPGGLLVIDNANWFLPSDTCAPDSVGNSEAPRSERWQEVWKALSDWRRVWTSNGVFDTVLFFKPC